VKHLLSRIRPTRYQKQWPLTPIRAREPRWIGFEGACARSAWRCCFLLRQRDAAPSRVARALPDRLAPVTHGDSSASSTMAAIAARAVARAGWKPWRPWDGRRRSMAVARWQWRTFTLHGDARSIRTHRSALSFNEAEAFRALGQRRCDEARVGAGGRRAARGKFRRERRPASSRFAKRRRERAGAGFGDVWEWTAATTARIRFQAAAGAVGNTTVSSCPANCCAAAPVRRRGSHRDYRISSGSGAGSFDCAARDA